MARTNFVKTINYVLPIAGVRGNYSENQINNMLHALFLIQANRSVELTQEQQQWKKKLILTPEQQTRLQRLLFKHFPVLGPMMADVADHKAHLNKKKSKVQTEDEAFEQLRGVSLADCLEMIVLMGETLTECRNFYTHCNPYNKPSELAKQYQHQAAIAKKLDKVVTASRRILKDRNGLSVNEVEFLTGIDRMEQVDVLDEYGRPKMVKGRKMKSFKEYEDFYFSLWEKRPVEGITKNEGDGNLATIDTKLPALSDFGLLYFCVLFLSKPYAKLFMDEARLFEFSPFEGKENIIMQEMMCIYRVRTPQPHRIDSRDNKATLAMDMFGELRRCPIELYDLLNKETGQPFFHDEVKRTNAFTPEISKQIRYTDRFPQLALRYIDENDLFKRIRFQLQLGAFRYKFYDKECVDGRIRVRRIQKDINGYGRPQEVNEKRFDKWEGLIQKREERSVKLEHEELYIDLDQFQKDSAESTPYITDRRPSYNIHANRIGMYWEESQNPRQFKYFDENKMYIPELTVDDDGKATIAMPAPRCSLSIFDLSGMLFYEYLREQSDTDYPSAEQIIINCESDYHRFFSAVAEGTLKPFQKTKELRDYLANNYPNLRMADIPEKLRLYLSGKRLTHNNMPETARQRLVRLTLEHLEEREQRVQRRLDHYEEDRKKIGDKENKYGKKDFSDVRHGVLARYLAQSMMEWQPTKDGEGNDKLTGLNYNVLMAYLATFGMPQVDDDPNFVPRTIEEMLQHAHLLGGSNPHPFIPKVLSHEVIVNKKTCRKEIRKPRNIEEFYLFYLEEELKHIHSRKRSLESNASDKALAALPFVHHERMRFRERTAEEMKALASRYTTIQLPDGLFTPYIVKLLKAEYADNEALGQVFTQQTPCRLNPVNNAAYLVTLFYQTVLHDNTQPFYISDKAYSRQNADGKAETFSFKRAYELFTTLADDKEDFFPYELKPLFLTSDDIQTRISAKAIDETGEPIAKIGKKGKTEKDPQGNTIWLREISGKIDNYVNSRTDKDLKISPNQSWKEKEAERKLKRDALTKRLNQQIKDVKASERTLRRYKTQDMVLFLLAKSLFTNILSDQEREVNWEHLRLAKVCDDAFLRQTLTFRVPVTVGERTIFVEQKNMSLKNYGAFYRFLTDDRLMSLIENITDTLKPNEDGELVIRHTDLMSELAAYDQKRSTVFKLIQQIEALIVKGNDALNNPDSPDFWAKPGLPKRNNFSSLLELIDHLNQTALNTEERTLLVAIRNAFSHNSYNLDLSQIAGVKHLPEVANSILQHLEAMMGENNNSIQ
ncbi:MAG: type VI-B CRISPR-associated RNA-guided ribonuclease Cas13b [Bacteroidaceae bacterium]|nr:type VI-B CRISPR-associated RNA-guided ribonuclease Cas13b [Bacteroidaceae bacterium]